MFGGELPVLKSEALHRKPCTRNPQSLRVEILVYLLTRGADPMLWRRGTMPEKRGFEFQAPKEYNKPASGFKAFRCISVRIG